MHLSERERLVHSYRPASMQPLDALPHNQLCSSALQSDTLSSSQLLRQPVLAPQLTICSQRHSQLNVYKRIQNILSTCRLHAVLDGGYLVNSQAGQLQMLSASRGVEPAHDCGWDVWQSAVAASRAQAKLSDGLCKAELALQFQHAQPRSRKASQSRVESWGTLHCLLTCCGAALACLAGKPPARQQSAAAWSPHFSTCPM